MERKNLANCTPREFLKQTNRIKKSVEKWLTVNEISEIRKRMPDLTKIDGTLLRKEAIRKQSMENVSAILDNALDKHPDETLEVLALCCFIEPEDIDTIKVTDLLASFNELVGNEEVIGFFISLARLGQMNTLNLSKQSDQI